MYPNNFRAAGDPRPYWSACLFLMTDRTVFHLKILWTLTPLPKLEREYMFVLYILVKAEVIMRESYIYEVRTLFGL